MKNNYYTLIVITSSIVITGILILYLLSSHSISFLASPYKQVTSEQTMEITNQNLITLDGDTFHFGTTIYPFRSNQDIPWLLSEAKELGLTELRVEYPREHVERAKNSLLYDESNYSEGMQDRINLLRSSHFDYIFVLDGHEVNAQKKAVDWPRNADGTINGKYASMGMANFARWVVLHTHDFVKTYELWNEAFASYWDSFRHKGFGPGGSLLNANNYANMMLPVVREIKSVDKTLQIAVEGNYWNLDRSVSKSSRYQELLQQANFAIIHPYTYDLHAYESPQKTPTDKGGNLYNDMKLYKTFNPNIDFWWSEYNVSPKSVGLKNENFSSIVQAKSLLRASLLHMLHGVKHLDMFDLYYPTKENYTLIDEHKNRKLAWYAFQRFLAAVGQKQPSINDSLIRTTPLSSGIRDLALAKSNGFSYFIWQETPANQFENTLPSRVTTVSLKSSRDRLIHLVQMLDPITGNQITSTVVQQQTGITLTIPVVDYPLIVTLSE